MVRSLLLASVLCFHALTGQAAAQTAGPRINPAAASGANGGSSIELLPRRSPFQATLEGEVVQPLGQGEVGDQSAEAIVLPSQPPEPAPPRWGALDAPAPQVEFPAREYDMVGPPRGILQRYTGQLYRRRVRDPNTLLADDYRLNAPIDLNRPDGIAPAGVLGDHTLKSSQFLISYRYNVTAFDGNLNGTQPVSSAAILGAFAFAPTTMTFQQHLILFEYAPTDDLTLMFRLPIQEIDIEYVDQGGHQVHTANTQLADIPITLMYALKRWNRQQIHLNFGLSTPTGIIDTLTDHPTAGSPNLGFPQRTGSGTWDLLPGLTYTGQSDRWTWGAQAMGTVHMGRNRFNYTLGDRVDLTPWVARRWTRGMSTSARLDGQIVGNGRGVAIYRVNPSLPPATLLDPTLAPTNNLNTLGGRRLDLLFGLNYNFVDQPRLPGSRLSIEAGCPIYQSLDGPQLRARWLLNASWNILW
ncbi:MAG TPA: hypothetical protein VND64_20360 [Pirellulales bacterium]|nr:hypothetical protein [Pirellulales bacterium]